MSSRTIKGRIYRTRAQLRNSRQRVKMDFQKQPLTLPVANVDGLVGENVNAPKRHGLLLPNSIRAVFCGPSACGKTNALISLIIHPNGSKFENVVCLF